VWFSQQAERHAVCCRVEDGLASESRRRRLRTRYLMRRSSKCKYLRCLLASAKSSSYPSSVFQSDLCQLPNEVSEGRAVLQPFESVT